MYMAEIELFEIYGVLFIAMPFARVNYYVM